MDTSAVTGVRAPPLAPTYSGKKGFAAALAIIGVALVIFALLGAFGDFKSDGFVAATSIGGALILIAAGTYYFYVRKERIDRGIALWTQQRTAQLHEATMRFAGEELRAHPETKVYIWEIEMFKAHSVPVRKEILQLLTLHYDELAALQETLKTKSWSDPDVIRHADRAMKFAYAVASMTLDDLPTTITGMQSKLPGEKPTAVNAFNQCNSTFVGGGMCKFSQIYHHLRAGSSYNSQRIQHMLWLEDDPPRNKNDRHLYELFDTPTQISAEHASRFYDPTSIQCMWRLLFNAMCERVAHHFPLEEMRQAGKEDSLLWHQKDEGPHTFKA